MHAALALAGAVFSWVLAAPAEAATTAAAVKPAMAASAPAMPASAPQRVRRTRVVTMTRFVRVFTDLEYDLIDALRNDDKAALNKLVAPEFEQREASQPGNPVPRDDWLKANDTKLPGIAELSGLAVHEKGDLALASFRLRLERQELFIVDVWHHKGGDDYELAIRYVSSTAAPPLAPPVPPAPPSAPDGKG